MNRPIINLEQLEYSSIGKGDRFEAERAPVSPRIGATQLGYAVIRLAPGKSAWPYHSHRVIEEMFYILEGQGTLRHGGNKYAVVKGDFICSPADPNQPHQLSNTSDHPLVYIALSTQATADIMHYPDSNKFGVWHGSAHRPDAPENFLKFIENDTTVDYWDGEDD